MSAGRERVVGQLWRPHPGKGLAPDRLRFIPYPDTAIKLKVHRFFGVLVSDSIDQLADRHFDPQFLPEFALQAVLEAFFGLAFAPGKLPKIAQMVLRTPLRDQNLPVTENYSSSNLDGVPSTVLRRVNRLRFRRRRLSLIRHLVVRDRLSADAFVDEAQAAPSPGRRKDCAHQR